MPIKNKDDRYGVIAILFHWVMAILIIGLIIIGLQMVDFPVSLKKLKYFSWHKEYGMLALMLGGLRFVWRLTNTLPHLPEEIPRWQEQSARFVHRLFYGYIFLLPITGWILTSAAGFPVSFFGLFIFPDLVAPNKALLDSMIFIHKWMSYALVATIFMHTFAALVHHFYYKDEVLKRIIK